MNNLEQECSSLDFNIWLNLQKLSKQATLENRPKGWDVWAICSVANKKKQVECIQIMDQVLKETTYD